MLHPRYYKGQEVFAESVGRAIKKDILPNVDKWEEGNHFPDTIFKTLGAQGFLGILIPEEFGGIGGDYRLAAAWCELFGEVPAVGFTTAINMHSLVISNALANYGSAKSKAEWLPRAVLGESIGAYAFTEPGAGSDLANIRTKAEKHGDKWILNGSKTFITNGARANFILVLARHDTSIGYKGFTTFVVDTTLPGFKVQRKLDKLGWRSSDTAELTFDNVTLSEEDVLGKIGDGWIQAAKSLNWERLMLTFTSLGGAKACMHETLQYVKDRRAFGQALIEFDVVADLLLKLDQKILLGEALVHHALDLHCEGKECRAEVAMAKRLVCEDAVWIADRAIQLHGGYGYTKEFLPERWWRDLRLMTIGGGTSEIMGNIAIKSLI